MSVAATSRLRRSRDVSLSYERRAAAPRHAAWIAVAAAASFAAASFAAVSLASRRVRSCSRAATSRLRCFCATAAARFNAWNLARSLAPRARACRTMDVNLRSTYDWLALQPRKAAWILVAARSRARASRAARNRLCAASAARRSSRNSRRFAAPLTRACSKTAVNRTSLYLSRAIQPLTAAWIATADVFCSKNARLATARFLVFCAHTAAALRAAWSLRMRCPRKTAWILVAPRHTRRYLRNILRVVAPRAIAWMWTTISLNATYAAL
mmetsp:Transcript_4686/g.19265  ORF Transcript_4686/g.19265 Transcript_4686/m.19265 type:complete len:269 (+) Transcript_4686:1442-2248(+)